MITDVVVKAQRGAAVVIEATWDDEGEALDVIDRAYAEARKKVLSHRESRGGRQDEEWGSGLPHA